MSRLRHIGQHHIDSLQLPHPTVVLCLPMLDLWLALVNRRRRSSAHPGGGGGTKFRFGRIARPGKVTTRSLAQGISTGATSGVVCRGRTRRHQYVPAITWRVMRPPLVRRGPFGLPLSKGQGSADPVIRFPVSSPWSSDKRVFSERVLRGDQEDKACSS